MSSARWFARAPHVARAPYALLLLGTALLATSGIAGEAHAQGTVGFRSGFTEGNGIPPRNRVDLDYGTSATNAAGVWGFSAGEVTAHVPMARRFGVRLHFNSYTWVKTPQATVAGREDMGIGTALHMRDNNGWRPSAALLTRVDIPSGSLPGQGNAWRPTTKVALGWRLPAGITLASNLGLAVPGTHSARYTQAFGSLWLGRHVRGRVGAFGEVFAFNREARTGPSTRYARAGLTVLVTNSFHLDLNASTQFGGSTPRRSIGIGAKHRL